MKHPKNPMERRVRLKHVNPHITCALCKGYLIEATTITECLHTFCKSCIVRYLEEHKTCPKCKLVIHQSHPLNYISHDRTMQDIVFKLVAKLQENERAQQENFYRKRGLPIPRQLSGGSDTSTESMPQVNGEKAEENNNMYHREDEQMNVCLECSTTQMKALRRRFIRCSALMTVQTMKKFIASKIFNNIEKFKDIDLLCNEEILGKDHTLKFVCVTRWRYNNQNIPLKLNFRPRCVL